MEKGRIRWRCRRALLELDLVFRPFLAEGFDQLSDAELAALDEMLALEDHDLWPMVHGTKPAPRSDWQALIAKIQAAHRRQTQELLGTPGGETNA
ncbi:FAD assembly factor SdhE [Hydrogenophilus thermoluteolus]|uniref:FAD assembly factor SdhE n=1 Tax=Hydrogenophilus thermoluteolus TaxID=297 RepID=A0A2Z6DWL6_HYDTE|nr:succinate dehydrogenase assembly factor 2 [Hydrogenophilus thermoluteolus]HCO77195.1 succinate dehydrogenase assembly factor 2 [Rhodocyclaceae bacterium]MBW7657357.1 succinate dehydrogenase assembly factor 2 [Hydrogenophilus thermoluteolus]BBD76850.1 succinate dehydrogenase assembly factor 2 [Hydrogenophilus thermoluteolus]HNQ49096.1 succinate dehydrogenase assembly factor 2 [Hydrogenophilus thermoluteolus]HNU19131.1 succinate dehydrogenase assembly factor 2 [Hydrogenophilus thermoluteolus]